MIYHYQQQAYQKLLRTAKAHLLAQKNPLPVKPRFHKLVIGPSGTGKTHISEAAADASGMDYKVISVAGWTVLGGKETPTWQAISAWLADDCALPKCLILDELDKIHGGDSWTRYLRAEIFAIMDGMSPATEESAVVRDKLKKMWVIGCGAFQDAFDERPSVGFGEEAPEEKTSAHISKYLQIELVNRFDSELLVMPHLQQTDYRRMVADLKPHIPEDTYKRIQKHSEIHIEEAVKSKSAARFVENMLSQAIYDQVDAFDSLPLSILNCLETSEDCHFLTK